MVIWATVLAAALGWAPLHGLLSAGQAAPAPTRGRTPIVVARLPLSAQGQLSGMVAEGRPAFQATVATGGYKMVNLAQTLTARFARSGVSIAVGPGSGLRVGLKLSSLSEDGVGSTIGAVPPKAAANRVSYTYGAVREWYRNGPLGLEQGYEIKRSPSRRRTAPLIVGMSLRANAPASLSPDGQRLTFAKGSTMLTYDGLVVTDASGRTLRSRLVLATSRLSIVVDTRGARFPLTIDPLIQQGGKLTSGEPEDEARFGTSAALSGDGNTLLIGAPQDNGSRGSVWVFVRSGGSWAQQGPKLAGGAIGPGGAEECAEESAEEAGECSFGASVALSADGNTALVGDPSYTSTAGVAWVFTRTGTTWSGGEQLPGGDEEQGQGRFGRSVALSADGDTALIGDPSAALQRGAAWVFTRSSGGPWTPDAELTGAETRADSHFGRSVAISANGSEALIGVPGASGYVGAAWMFARRGYGWSVEGSKLVGTEEIGNGHFGKSVALSGDGATALIGGLDDNGEQGAVWAFARAGNGESFVQQGEKLVGTPEAGSHFGESVALSGDGTVALIGAPREESGIGTVTAYARSGSSWGAIAPALGGTEAEGKGATGTSVALSQDGEVAAIGAPRDGKRAGAAWVFGSVAPTDVPGPTVTAVIPGHGPAAGGTPVTVKGTSFNNEGGHEPAVMFGSTPATSVRVRSGAELTAVSPAGSSGAVVDVTVQTSAGVSATSGADTFKYEAPAKTGNGAGSAGGGSLTTTIGAPTGAAGVLGSIQTAGPACRVWLGSKHLVVALHRTAPVRLTRSGTGQCRGTLTLRYRQRRGGHRFRMRTIGSVRFSIAPGKSQVVSIELNKLGRSLFVAGHGRLNASAVMVRTTPTPSLTRTASIRLSVEKSRKPKPVRLY